jgi:hypothetical protein
VVLRRSVNFVAIASTLCALFGFGPQGPLVVLLIAFPWITLLLVKRFRPDLSINGSRASDMALGVLFPSLALTFRALYDCTPLDWPGPVVMAIVGTALLTFGAAHANEDRMNRWALLVLGILCTSYGYGAGMEINARLDTTVPKTYAVKVLSKRISNGKNHTRYLTVEPWGPKAKADEVTVPGGTYNQIKIGDRVCINWHPGALGVAWYALSLCPAPSAHWSAVGCNIKIMV